MKRDVNWVHFTLDSTEVSRLYLYFCVVLVLQYVDWIQFNKFKFYDPIMDKSFIC